jgi:uncharacterized RDD family membrane protein YckC
MLEYPVITPENVRFHYRLAGPGTRLVAWLIDMVLVALAMVVISIGYALALPLLGGYANAALGLAGFLLVSGYWIAFEYFATGVTPGKRALGLRVIGDLGLPLTLGQVVLRNLVRFVDLLPGPGTVAAVTMVGHPQHKRLGDVVAGTLVIQERRRGAPEQIRGLSGGEGGGSVVSALGLAALSQAERGLIVELSFRRDRLEDSVRLGLFSEVAERLRSLPGAEVHRALSDENLVLATSAALLDRAAR